MPKLDGSGQHRDRVPESSNEEDRQRFIKWLNEMDRQATTAAYQKIFGVKG
jgi:hypothetical protein